MFILQTSCLSLLQAGGTGTSVLPGESTFQRRQRAPDGAETEYGAPCSAAGGAAGRARQDAQEC